jgi:peroxiredoxin Q/BCP
MASPRTRLATLVLEPRKTRASRRLAAFATASLLVSLASFFLFPTAARAGDLAVGDPAPDFALTASDGRIHRLSDYKGRQAIVVAWFPMAFTSGCTIECKSLAEDGDLLEAYDVTYFMASVDPVEGEKGNAAFAKAHSARFPILSDPTKATAAAFGVLSPSGYANRWTFYVDKDGKIAFIDKEVSSRLATSAQDMAKKLGELGVPKRARP